MTKRQALIGFFLLTLSMILIVGPALAAETNKRIPARGLVAALLYPGLTVGQEDKIRVDLAINNTGRSNEVIFLDVIEKPKGWKAYIKGFSNNVVSGIFMPDDSDRTLSFHAEPEGKEKRLPPGKYHFVVQARTRDGVLKSKTAIDITVVEQKKVKGAVRVTTSYPVLRGPSDTKFEFSLDVNNDSEEDAIFNLQAVAPEDWEVSFKPGYEQKQISSLRIKANQSQTVGVEVTPPFAVEAGEYPVKIRIQSPKGKAETDLTVVLTGTYKIKLGTLKGLLSLTTQTGKAANMSIYVRNEGSAPQREVSFVSFKPESWKVEFAPEKLQNLKPGEMKQVEVTITTADEALVGDYSVSVKAQGEKGADNVELRVTVKASAAWGWIGVAIILLVIGGLAFVFRRLGRR